MGGQAQGDRLAIKMLVAAGFVTEAKANEALNIAHGFDRGPLEQAQGGGEAVQRVAAFVVEYQRRVSAQTRGGLHHDTIYTLGTSDATLELRVSDLAAMLAAAPPSAPGCGACADGCNDRGSCRVRDESPPSAPVGVDGPHPETADLVRRFAHAVAEKLAEAERKYGWDTHWKSPAWMDQCREQLVAHVAKGDPRDVAAYAAFLWHHGEPTALAQQPAAVDGAK